MSARQQLIELMQDALPEAHTNRLARVLDAILSDEGRPLLWTLMDARPVPAADEAWMVEYLKERGVLVAEESDPVLRYIARPTMSLPGDRDPEEFVASGDAQDQLVRAALATCIRMARTALKPQRLWSVRLPDANDGGSEGWGYR